MNSQKYAQLTLVYRKVAGSVVTFSMVYVTSYLRECPTFCVKLLNIVDLT